MKYVLLLAFFLASCGHGPEIKSGVVDCTVNEVIHAQPELLQLVDALLYDGTLNGLGAAAKLHGKELITCLVSRLLFAMQNSKSLAGDTAKKIATANAWLASQPFQAKF